VKVAADSAVAGGDERMVAVAVDASVPPADAEDAPSLAGAEAGKDPEA
jgi:hypothetical protein